MPADGAGAVGDEAPKEAQPGVPLDRLMGAQRDTRPAWMTKGEGVGEKMFGKAGEGDQELMKPGLTRGDLERIEKGGLAEGPDPFAELFAERKGAAGPGAPPAAAGAATTGRSPLTDQKAMFSTGKSDDIGGGAQATQEQEDDDYDPFAEKPTENAKEAPQGKAKAPKAKAPPAVSAVAAEEEAPWNKKAPWRARRKAARKGPVELQLPEGPKLQEVPFDPDNLAASVQAIVAESKKMISDKVSKKAKEGKIRAPWRAAQPQAPPPKHAAGPPALSKRAQQLPPWRRAQQLQPVPPPSKAGKASLSKAAHHRQVQVKGKSQGAPAKWTTLSKAAGVKTMKTWAKAKFQGSEVAGLTKAAGVKAATMGAMAKSKASIGFQVRMKFRPPPPKAAPGYAALRPPPRKAWTLSKAGAKAAAPAQPWAKASMRKPWWVKQAARFTQSMEAKVALPKHKGKGKGKGDAKANVVKTAAETAKNFLSRPNNKRLNDAAAAAQEYFKHAEPSAADGDSASKRPRVEAIGFAPELLEKAPAVLQTCRSLLEFLDKKHAALTKPAVEIQIAADLQPRLGQHADLCGRIAGLRRPGGWDARAKRIFDLGALVGSAECQAALTAAEARLAKPREAFEKELLERGLNDKSIEELTKERTAWADDQVRREWIAWCARIARAKEAELLAAAQQGETKPALEACQPRERLTAAGVVEAILSGRLAGS